MGFRKEEAEGTGEIVPVSRFFRQISVKFFWKNLPGRFAIHKRLPGKKITIFLIVLLRVFPPGISGPQIPA
jgi:hypothetical protein